MPVSASNLDGSALGAGISTQDSASISPVANSLLYISVASYVAAATPNIPTVTGCGLTWVQVDTKLDATNHYRLTVLRALGAAPSTGVLTMDYGGQVQIFTNYGIDQFLVTDKSGTNGSGATVQDATSTQATGTTPLATLAAFSSADNATFGVCFCEGTEGITEGSGFTALDYHASNTTMKSEFKATNDTSVDFTLGGNRIANVIAIEIKVASAAGHILSTNSRYW